MNTPRNTIEEYQPRFQEDRDAVLLRAAAAINVPPEGASSIRYLPKDILIQALEGVEHPAHFLGFQAAEQLVGMICHTYQLTEPAALSGRVHIEHGLVISVSPDDLLALSRDIAADNEAVESAFRHYALWLVKEGEKAGSFTRKRIKELLESDKDLAVSRAAALLKPYLLTTDASWA